MLWFFAAVQIRTDDLDGIIEFMNNLQMEAVHQSKRDFCERIFWQLL